MRILIKTNLEAAEIIDRLNKSEEFIASTSNQYNKRLMYEHAVNMHFISQVNEAEFLISENAGYGGFHELFASLIIREDNLLEVKFKRGGLNFNWAYILALGSAFISLIFVVYSPYILILSVFLFMIAKLIQSANRKSVRIITEKLDRLIGK